MINVDIKGFGKSDELPYAYTVDDYVKDILSLIDALKLDKYHLIAHSFGGRLALKIANLDKRLEKLVLTGSAGLRPKRKLNYYVKVLKYKIAKRFLSESKLQKYGSSEYKQLKGYLKASFVKIVNEHLDDYAKTINNKTLIVFGEKDTETPIYMAKKLNANIKNSTLYIMKNQGHFCFLENPHEFNVIVNEFLGE